MNKTKFYSLVGLLSIGYFAASCGDSKPKDGRTDTYTSGVIEITSDESFSPIIQEEIDVFEGLHKDAIICPIFTDEVNAINMLLHDSVRLAIATRKFTESEMKAFLKQKRVPVAIPIATDGLAFIVNKENHDTLISVDNIRRILTGQAKKWTDINPSSSNANDITLVFDNPNSSTVRFAIDSICGGKKITAPNVRAVKTSQQVLDYISKSKNAIGVIGVNWLTDKADSLCLTFKSGVNVMSVSGSKTATKDNSFKPFQYYLFSEQYPLRRTIYALVNDPRRCLSWGFAQFLSRDKGQKVILKAGLLPEMPVMIRATHINE